ncbi:MAG: DUF2892 domain-containing protein [Fimbriimonadaceae bacterium]|nr:DUF2892 domain-containing protein [Fimbriimonadaceae bacterium]QYK58328.1 MAG: DUF2892 domain-containing protein [Fimbriimonadaceae bacterium]
MLAGTALASLGYPIWIFLAMFVGAGLTFAGLANVCGLAHLLAKLPWNRPKPQPTRFNVEARQS